MTLTEQIKDIRKASEDGRLVIFVGSGVSINSGFPSWNDLVEEFAEKLAYDKCESCKCKSEKCPIDKCQQKTNFTQDECLKIPEYYYCQNSPEEYQAIVKKCFNKSVEPNPIDDIIFHLTPHHIITTNYDHLLEDSKEPNRRLYFVITKNEELLSPKASQYIIKMHGDIDDLDNIVLKESDYTNYSQNHVFIETFITSLLINHTFLFVGYSFSDYNLKLILGRVNYFANKNKSRQNYYLIQTQSEIKSYELKYFTENNLQILNTNEIPQKIIEHAPNELDDCGKRVYACLDCICDENYDFQLENDFQLEKLEDILSEKYRLFDEYRWISSQDLLSVYSFGNAEMRGRYLLIRDNDIFSKIESILKNNSDNAEFIKRTFRRTGISGIRKYDNDHVYYDLPVSSEIQNLEDRLFQLYLDNQYEDLCFSIENIDNKAISAYYFWLCAPQKKKHNELMEELKKDIPKESVIGLLFFTYNSMQLDLDSMQWDDYTVHRTWFNKILKLLSPKQERITKYLPKIINTPAEELSELQEYLKVHKSCYAPTKCTIISTRFGNIGYMQALAYDYYFYCKRNYLMADRTSNMVVFLEPYLEAILCTYGPPKNLDKTNTPLIHLFSMYQPERQHPLSEIDLDMFVKHTNPETLLGWLSKYKVDTIIYEDGIDVSEKYSNLCAHLKTYSELPGSIRYSNDMNWLKSFSILLTKSKLSPEKTDAIIEAISNLLEVDFTNIHHAYLRPILFALSGLIPTHPSEKWNSVLKILIDKISKSLKIMTVYCHDEYFRCLELLSQYADPEIKLKIENFLDSVDNCSDKCNCLFLFAKYVDWTKWSLYLLENLQDLKVNKLCCLVGMDYLPMDGRVMERFIQEIQDEIRYRETGSRHLDPIQESITGCIYLHIKKRLDITQLTPYCEYSDALSFLLDPDRFDYTKVNTRDPEWYWIFSNEHYAQILKEHKSEIISEKLVTEYKNGQFTPGQYRIVFGILLDQEELWTFGYK